MKKVKPPPPPPDHEDMMELNHDGGDMMVVDNSYDSFGQGGDEMSEHHDSNNGKRRKGLSSSGGEVVMAQRDQEEPDSYLDDNDHDGHINMIDFPDDERLGREKPSLLKKLQSRRYSQRAVNTDDGDSDYGNDDSDSASDMSHLTDQDDEDDIDDEEEAAVDDVVDDALMDAGSGESSDNDHDSDQSTVVEGRGDDNPALRRYFVKQQEAYMRKTDASGLHIIHRGKKLMERRRDCALPADDSAPLHAHTTTTKGAWARRAIQFFPDGGADALAFLRDTMPPGINFPLSEGSQSTLTSYCPQQTHILYLEFHVCPDGCHVFGEAGENSEQTNCPKCKLARYLPGGRTPAATIHYRPLIPLIETLLQYEVFVQAMLHEQVSAVHGGVIHDLLDGFEIKTQLAQMRKQFTKSAREDPQLGGHVPLYMLFGEFWDGAKVHTHVITKFYTTFITFSNLPPSMRGVVGVGTFLLALDTYNTSCTRDFIFKRCLLPELQLLEMGTVIKSTVKSYYVLGRMMVHSLDGKALETMFQVQASTALAPCPICGQRCGVSRPTLHKVYFCHHRALLPRNNFLRSIGRSGRDYPAHFEDKDVQRYNSYRTNEAVLAAHNKLKQGCLTLVDHGVMNDQSVFTAPLAQVNGMLSSMRDHTGRRRKPFDETSFANDHRLVARVIPVLDYPHAEFDFIEPGGRSSNDTYFTNGMNFGLNMAAAAAEAQLRGKKTIKKVDPVNGSSGVIYLAPLLHFNIKQANYDGFHAVMGLCKHLQQNLMGDRHYYREHADLVGCHLNHFTAAPNVDKTAAKIKKGKSAKKTAPKSVADWVFSQRLQDKVDAFIDSLRVPTGASDHFEVKKLPFRRSGHLKGVGTMQLFAYVLPAFLSVRDHDVMEYGDAYHAFLQLVGQMLKGLLSPVFTERSIAAVQAKTVEVISMLEGILPDSESTFTVHEVVDLPKSLAQYGPLRCWWTLYGERAISKIKRFLPFGGKSFNKTTLGRYMLREELDTHLFYSNVDNLKCDKDFLEIKTMPDSKFTICSKLSCSRLYSSYSDVQMSQIRNAANVVGLYQFKLLLECLTLMVEDEHFIRADGLELALFASAFYRLYYYFAKNVLPSKRHRVAGSAFQKWIFSAECTDHIRSAPPGNIRPVPVRPGAILVALNAGYIFADFAQVVEDIHNFEVELYRIAILNGVRLNSRDWICRERSSGGSNGCPKNNLNVLREHWHLKKHYSSWCTVTPACAEERMRKQKPLPCFLSRAVDVINAKFAASSNFSMNKMVNDRSLHAQINIFMVLRIPSDQFLNRQVVASVCCRLPDQDNARMVSCIDSVSFVPEISYVPMKDIKPVRYGIVGYDCTNKPFPPTASCKEADEKLYSSAEFATVDHLILCELDGANESFHCMARNEMFKMGYAPDPSVLHIRATPPL